MKVAFHTLGCKVNHYETEAIKEAFVLRGAEITGEEDFADAYVINTCTVTNIADRKSRQFIRRAKRINPDAVIAVTGCYAQVAAEEVAAIPEVDIVVGNRLKSEICGMVLEKLAKTGRATDETAADVHVLPRNELTFYEDMGKIESGADGMSRAYIKIQDGCDRFCSYCLIPYARGPVKSRPAKEIVEETVTLVNKGYREIVLTGINTALYGTEDGAECSISELLTMLDDPDLPCEDFRIRLSSLEPTVVDKDNVEEIIRHRRLCHHLHLSVQNGSDAVLKSMNRHYDRAEYLDIVRAIREYDPLYGITTDIIVGFPGETDDDFADTLDIVKDAEFGKVHVFRYSPRRGTAGAKLPGAVNGEIKIGRAEALEAVSEKVSTEFKEKNLNTTHEVLIEEIEDGFATGYTGNYIKTYIKAGSSEEASAWTGQILTVKPFRLFKDGILAEPSDQ